MRLPVGSNLAKQTTNFYQFQFKKKTLSKMSKTKQSKTPHNAFLLNICTNDDEIVRVVNIEPHEVNLMKELITDIYENQSGGVTIRLSLKSNYIKDEISN
jgi:hypothetical protein